jgi:hypothetical protein
MGPFSNGKVDLSFVVIWNHLRKTNPIFHLLPLGPPFVYCSLFHICWNWTSCTMDFANALIQSKLESPKWIHLPHGFQSELPGKVCLHLK